MISGFMINRVTAFVFLLFANIVLLAHSFVPHHHHQARVCVESRHCLESHISQKQSNPKHDGNSPTDCVLKQAVVLPANQIKQECTVNYGNDTSSNDYYFASLSVPAAGIFNYYADDPFPVISFSYSCFACTALGLRAPPLV